MWSFIFLVKNHTTYKIHSRVDVRKTSNNRSKSRVGHRNVTRLKLGCTYLSQLPPCWKPFHCRMPQRHLHSPPAQSETDRSPCGLCQVSYIYKTLTFEEPSSRQYLTVKIQDGNTITNEVPSPVRCKSFRTDIIDPKSADVGGVFDVM